MQMTWFASTLSRRQICGSTISYEAPNKTAARTTVLSMTDKLNSTLFLVLMTMACSACSDWDASYLTSNHQHQVTLTHHEEQDAFKNSSATLLRLRQVKGNSAFSVCASHASTSGIRSTCALADSLHAPDLIPVPKFKLAHLLPFMTA